jgi:6-phosphogluconolactonase (cycloisomerase 2 family)
MFVAKTAVALCLACLISGCGGGGHPTAQVSYAIGGNVTGLAAGQQLTLLNNNADALIIKENGPFVFQTAFSGNSSYSVQLEAQPTGQTCSVSGGSGEATAAISSIKIVCTTNSYSIGGQVVNLQPGTSITLADNGQDLTGVSANGRFVFPLQLAANSPYEVTVSTQPTGQVCAVDKGKGNVGTAQVADISIMCAPIAQYIYALDNADNLIAQYRIGDDGTLIPLSVGTIATGSNPQSITIDPSHRFVYVTNSDDDTIFEYQIGSDGHLTQDASRTFQEPAGSQPDDLEISPAGTFAYVLNYGSNSVSPLRLGAEGQLEANGPETPVALEPSWAAISLNGQNLYIPQYLGDALSQYGITGSGALLPKNPPAVATGHTPSAVTIDPSGKHVYVANYYGNSISMYSIGNTGELAPLSPATVAAGTEPNHLIIDPTGRHAYAVNSNGTGLGSISLYAVDDSGVLLPSATAPTEVRYGVSTIVFDQTGRFAYVPSGRETSIWQFSVDASGNLTPLNTPYISTNLRATDMVLAY